MLHNSLKIAKSLLPQGMFARGVTVLAGSNAIGQILALAAAPILTRIYSPADFGVLGVYIAITTILSVIVCLRYNLAIPLPPKDSVAINVLCIALLCTLITTSFSLILVVKYSREIATVFNIERSHHIFYFVPVSVFLLGFFSTFNYWCVRKKEFGQIGKARILQVSSSLAAQIFLAPLGPIALVLGQLANQGMGCIRLGKRVTADRSVLLNVDRAALFKSLIRYKRFPLISTWAALLNRASAQLPTLLFAALFGPITAGLYSLAVRVVNTPSGVISRALTVVFMSTAPEAIKSGTIATLSYRTHSKLAILAMPLFFYISVISPDIFLIVFGKDWRIAGEFAQWLTMIVYFSVTVSPLMILFSVFEKHFHELAYQIFLFVVRALSLSVGWAYDSSYIAIILYTVGSISSYLVFLVWLTKQIDMPLYKFLKPMLKALAYSFVVVSPAIIGRGATDNINITLIGYALSALLLSAHIAREYSARA